MIMLTIADNITDYTVNIIFDAIDKNCMMI